MELLHSATNQKATKISIGTDSNLSQDSPKNDCRFSTKSEVEGLESTISTIRSRLRTHISIPDLPPSLESLNYMLGLMFDQLDLLNSKEIKLNNLDGSTVEEVSVNLMHTSEKDPITRIFEIPEQGVHLSKDDCKNISALIIGAFRDSASHALTRKLTALQEKVIGQARVNIDLKKELTIQAGINEELRGKLFEKDFEIEHLIEKLEEFEKKK
jgi:hypothetical protein